MKKDKAAELEPLIETNNGAAVLAASRQFLPTVVLPKGTSKMIRKLEEQLLRDIKRSQQALAEALEERRQLLEKRSLELSLLQNDPSQARYWTEEEHERFLQGVEKFGIRNTKAIAMYVGTRSIGQVRTHGQKYAQKLKRDGAHTGGPLVVPEDPEARSFGRKRRNKGTKRGKNKRSTKRTRRKYDDDDSTSEEEADEDDLVESEGEETEEGEEEESDDGEWRKEDQRKPMERKNGPIGAAVSSGKRFASSEVVGSSGFFGSGGKGPIFPQHQDAASVYRRGSMLSTLAESLDDNNKQSIDTRCFQQQQQQQQQCQRPSTTTTTVRDATAGIGGGGKGTIQKVMRKKSPGSAAAASLLSLNNNPIQSTPIPAVSQIDQFSMNAPSSSSSPSMGRNSHNQPWAGARIAIPNNNNSEINPTTAGAAPTIVMLMPPSPRNAALWQRHLQQQFPNAVFINHAAGGEGGGGGVALMNNLPMLPPSPIAPPFFPPSMMPSSLPYAAAAAASTFANHNQNIESSATTNNNNNNNNHHPPPPPPRVNARQLQLDKAALAAIGAGEAMMMSFGNDDTCIPCNKRSEQVAPKIHHDPHHLHNNGLLMMFSENNNTNANNGGLDTPRLVQFGNWGMEEMDFPLHNDDDNPHQSNGADENGFDWSNFFS